MKTLLVEVSKTQQSFIGKILQENSSEIEISESGGDALEKIKAVDFQLICISMVLPDMSGAELCSKIRFDLLDSSTPLIVLSSGDSKNSAECIEAGATDVFFKNDIRPFTDYIVSFFSSMYEQQKAAGSILYVEDSQVLASIVIQLLMQHGYSVSHYDNAEEAYAAYQKCSFDMLITDVILKGKMTGLRLVRSIRGNNKDSQLPILVMSGFNDSARTSELYRAGANDYVSKPPQNDELLSRVHNLMRSKNLFDQLQRRNTELSQLAIVDELTGLYNRRFINEMAQAKISDEKSHGQMLSVAVIDLDHFKLVNDTHGHPIGDKVLRHVSGLLIQVSTDQLIAARYGGEEFVLFMPDTDIKTGVALSEDIRQKISILKPAGLDISASIGVACLKMGDAETNFDKLFSQADDALYKAKETGRNRVVAQEK